MKARGSIGKVEAEVPSSTANLGIGFDVHSLSLKEPKLRVTLERADGSIRRLVNKGRYGALVTGELDKHSGAKALIHLYDRYGIKDGFVLTNRVEIPPRKGLGLSGAEAAGAVACANELYGLDLGVEELVRLAAKGEPSEHLDNVSASIKGGFNVAVRDPETGNVKLYTFSPPRDLGLAIIVPEIEKKSTEEARASLPNSIPREDYVEMLGRVSAVSIGFATGNVGMIIENLAWDRVIEPARARAGVYGRGVGDYLLREEKTHLLRNFHVAETVSGAGPSRALWYSLREEAERKRMDGIGLIGPAIEYVRKRLEASGHRVEEVIITKPSNMGAQVKIVR